MNDQDACSTFRSRIAPGGEVMRFVAHLSRHRSIQPLMEGRKQGFCAAEGVQMRRVRSIPRETDIDHRRRTQPGQHRHLDRHIDHHQGRLGVADPLGEPGGSRPDARMVIGGVMQRLGPDRRFVTAGEAVSLVGPVIFQIHAGDVFDSPF